MHDREPRPPATIEARTLTALGYNHVLGKPVPTPSPGGPQVLAEHFLDVYPVASLHRQETADLLTEFQSMESTDPDYPAIRKHILRYVETWFGPLPPQTGDTS